MSPRISWLSCILVAGASAATPPVITGASPDPIDAGGQAFLMTITGSGFVSGAVARLSETALSTTFVSSTQLRGEITPALRALSGHPILTVANPDGTVSNGHPIHISPVVGAIIPSAALAGGAAVTVTVTGIGITIGDVLLWNVPGKQTVIGTNFVDSTKFTALIPAELLSTAQSASIRIFEPLYEVTSTLSVTFDVLAVATLGSLSPNPVDAGGDYFLVTVAGTGFVPHSVVNWAGTPLGTTYVSSTQLKAAITPELRALSGTFPLTVTDPGVATSTAVPFTVSPVLFTVSPALAAAGGPAVNITATGVGFTRNDVLTFSTAALSTTYVSSTTLTAAIPAALLRTPGTATVQVSDSTGAGRSLPQPFAIIAPPAITTIAPTSATAGSPAFTLTITGANCPAGCVVQWNGSPLTTTHPADTTVTASVPGNLMAAAGAASVQLVNQYGGASNTATFTVYPAAAFLTSLSPSSVTAGSAAFSLTVYGTGFVAGSTVLWNGSGLGTSYTSGTQVTGFVTAILVSVRAGVNASVTVLNPGGAVSNSVTLAIDPPRPTILSLTPASAGAGTAALAMVITGTNFAANCVVRWNGTAVETTFGDAGHVSASVPASLLVNAGVVPITVTNPSGLVTSPMTFTVIPSTPAASGVSPASVTEGAPAFTLTVNGAYFAPASIVRWNNSALATTFVSTAQLTAAVPANLVAAAGNASITVSNPGGLISQAAGFVVAAAPPPALPAPAVTSGGVLNAFSSLPSVAPGTLISIYGTNLAARDGRATATPLPASLNGTSVSINGIPAPLLFVSATQINAQAPFETPLGTVALLVQDGALKSAPVKVDISAAAPGILALGGGSHALAVNYPGGALNAPQNPVHPGEYVVVYLTGQGLVDRPVASGAEAPANPLSLPLAAVRAKLGGIPAEVVFAGLAPGFVGLLQVNLLVPDIPGGEQALEVTVGGSSGQPNGAMGRGKSLSRLVESYVHMAKSIDELQTIAKRVRRDIVEMITAAKSGHPGGSLSAVEIVVELYFNHMRIDPANPQWADRDRFILSKGHAAPVLYSVMAERGYADTPKDKLNTLRTFGSVYQGHPDRRFIPSLEASTGSLGQGLSLGLGMALGSRLDARPSRFFVMLGDGEIQEGQIWESAMAAAFHKVDSLVAIVDYNRIQLDGFVSDIMEIAPVAEKWRQFGWHTLEIDGHDFGAIEGALAEAAATKGKPTCIVAHTIKGKGVSFMENNPKFHGVAPTQDELKLALQELN